MTMVKLCTFKMMTSLLSTSGSLNASSDEWSKPTKSLKSSSSSSTSSSNWSRSRKWSLWEVVASSGSSRKLRFPSSLLLFFYCHFEGSFIAKTDEEGWEEKESGEREREREMNRLTRKEVTKVMKFSRGENLNSKTVFEMLIIIIKLSLLLKCW